MKHNIPLFFGIAIVIFYTGIAVESIGEVPNQEPFSWYTPILVFLSVGVPFFSGYLAGRIDKQKGGR